MRPRIQLFLVSFAIWLALLTGCSANSPIEETRQVATVTSAAQSTLTHSAATLVGPTATEPPLSGSGPWDVTFVTEDGAQLSGIVYGTGTTDVILAPTYPGGKEGWAAFATAAAGKSLRSLAFDLRGYGKSQGTRSAADSVKDLEAAIQFLRSNNSQRIVVVGAGISASAAILVAGKGSQISGLVVISSPREMDGLTVADSDLSSLTIPSLWLATRNDMTQNVEDMYAIAGGKKALWVYEGSSLHGTYILEGADGPDLQRRLLEFIASVTAS